MLTCINSTPNFNTALFSDAHSCLFEKFQLFHKHSLSGCYVLSIELDIWDKEMRKIQLLTTRISQLTGGTRIPTTENAIIETIIIVDILT